MANEDLPKAIEQIKVGDVTAVTEFEPIPVHTNEEIGQLARAVDDMHGQALKLAGEQAHLRLQIGDMFETLARRSKSLVDQQLGLIENLEFEEKDPQAAGEPVPARPPRRPHAQERREPADPLGHQDPPRPFRSGSGR